LHACGVNVGAFGSGVVGDEKMRIKKETVEKVLI